MDPKAMYKLSYGLFVVSTEYGGKLNACITNTAIQVANSPDRLGLAINKSNLTHDLVMASGVFNISIISTDAKFDLFQRFGMQSGRDVDKFDGFTDVATAANGLPYVTKGTNAYMADTPSCTYADYQSNIKPKRSAAPAADEGAVYRCTICGFEYKEKDGDPANGIAPGTKWEDLPDDWVCPLCKHPKSDFEKV